MHIGSLYTGYVNFNPRTHEGCDVDGMEKLIKSIISIPAPTKGATYKFGWGYANPVYFNPRTHEGCDLTEG